MLFGELTSVSTAVIAELIAPLIVAAPGRLVIELSKVALIVRPAVGLRVAAKQNDRDHWGHYAPGKIGEAPLEPVQTVTIAHHRCILN